MKLATIRVNGTTAAVRLDGDMLVHLGAPDVGALLARPDWSAHAAAANKDGYYPADTADFAPLVPHPSKIVWSRPTSCRAESAPASASASPSTAS